MNNMKCKHSLQYMDKDGCIKCNPDHPKRTDTWSRGRRNKMNKEYVKMKALQAEFILKANHTTGEFPNPEGKPVTHDPLTGKLLEEKIIEVGIHGDEWYPVYSIDEVEDDGHYDATVKMPKDAYEQMRGIIEDFLALQSELGRIVRYNEDPETQE